MTEWNLYEGKSLERWLTQPRSRRETADGEYANKQVSYNKNSYNINPDDKETCAESRSSDRSPLPCRDEVSRNEAPHDEAPHDEMPHDEASHNEASRNEESCNEAPDGASDDASTLRWLSAMQGEGVRALIANVDTTLRALRCEALGVTLPLSVGDREYGDSYVFSPYTHYVSYAREELSLLESRAARALLGALLTPAGRLLKASRFNRAVQVNNRLLSTNLYPPLDASALASAVALLLREFPDRSIVFRSLNRRTTPRYLEALAEMGFRLVPSRQVYLYEAPDRIPSKARWLQKRDYGLLDKHGYDACGPQELSAADAPRLAELYRLLYLDKYSAHNPAFTPRFFERALRSNLLKLHALRSRTSGRLDAVLGYYAQGGIMTTPVFGYDTGVPQEIGLYRMLSAVLLRLAAEEGCLLHESAGAAQFKRNRGAVAEIEYSAVYDRHLPPHRRIGWALLSPLLNRVGVPIMRKHKL